ncbi:hypothetical protein BKA70DRAFT_385623 [Coprinopsis sp. MPI-PUGE-AT-0042]|nr:hypothetical protein BKA70DRAFT_385623 [Coprinopsis sp. MPI-PUGE-AT-0042]
MASRSPCGSIDSKSALVLTNFSSPSPKIYRYLLEPRTNQSDKIVTLTNTAGVDLEPIWASLLAKALEGKNIKELLSNVGAGGAAAEAPKEEAKKEEE